MANLHCHQNDPIMTGF